MVLLRRRLNQVRKLLFSHRKSVLYVKFGLTTMLCVFAMLLYFNIAEADKGTPILKHVQLLFRHGDRTPEHLYPNDPHRDWSKWPVGPGQLLDEGKLRHFQLGQYIRERYKNFLNDYYQPQDVYIRSTDMDRTLMSALSHLSGLYLPTSNETWNPDLKWQPIPVHTRLHSTDFLNSHSECEVADKTLSVVLAEPENMAYLKNHSFLLKKLSKLSGWELNSLKMFNRLYDALFIESRMKMTVPEWYKTVMSLRPLIERYHGIYCLHPTLKRLRGGPILQTMIETFENFQSNENGLKMFIISAHDTTISSLMCTMGVYNWIQPPYAAVLMLEFYTMGRSKYYVKLLYKNDSASEPYTLDIPGCDNPCPYNKFTSVMNPFIPNDWPSECIGDDNRIKYIVIGLLFIVVFIFTILLVLRCIGRRSIRKRYFSLDDL